MYLKSNHFQGNNFLVLCSNKSSELLSTVYMVNYWLFKRVRDRRVLYRTKRPHADCEHRGRKKAIIDCQNSKCFLN